MLERIKGDNGDDDEKTPQYKNFAKSYRAGLCRTVGSSCLDGTSEEASLH
jgi:hypothetical protein